MIYDLRDSNQSRRGQLTRRRPRLAGGPTRACSRCHGAQPFSAVVTTLLVHYSSGQRWQPAMVNCCVPFCRNRPDQKKFSFFSFPTDEKKRQLWLDRIGRKNPDGSKWVPKMSAKVCSYHFSRGRSFGAPDRFDRGPVETKRWAIIQPKERKSSLALRNSLPMAWRPKSNLPEFPWSRSDHGAPHVDVAPVNRGAVLTWGQARPVPTPPREPEVCSQHFADKFFRKYTGKPYVEKTSGPDRPPPEAPQEPAQPPERRALKRSAAAEASCIATKGTKQDQQEAAPVMVTLLVPVMTVPMVPCGQSSSIMVLQSNTGDTSLRPAAAGNPQMLLGAAQPQMVLGQSGQQLQMVLAPSGKRPQMVLASSGQRPQMIFAPPGQQPQMVLASPGQQPQMVLVPSDQQPQRVLAPSDQQPQMVLAASGQRPQMVLAPSDQQPQRVLAASGQRPQMVLASCGQRPQMVPSPSGHQLQMALEPLGKRLTGNPQAVNASAMQPQQAYASTKSPIPINSWELPFYQASEGEDKQALECYQAALSALREQMSKLQRDVKVLRQRAMQAPPFAQLARVVSSAKEGQESALLLLEQILAYDSHLHYWSPQMLQKCTAWRARSCHSYMRALKLGLFSLPCTGTLNRSKTHGPSQRWQSQWMLLADLLLR